jgi:hypothetical protein
MSAAVRLRITLRLMASTTCWLATLAVISAMASGTTASPLTQTELTTEQTTQASAMASALHIAYPLAVEDIKVQDAVGGLNEAIEEDLGTTFAGVWFDPWHARFDIGVAPSTNADLSLVSAAVSNAGVQAVTEYVPVKSTFRELRASQTGWTMRAGALMGKGDASTMISPASNSVVVDISETAPQSEVSAMTTAISDAATTDPAKVELKTVPPAAVDIKPASIEVACTFRAGAIPRSCGCV